MTIIRYKPERKCANLSVKMQNANSVVGDMINNNVHNWNDSTYKSYAFINRFLRFSTKNMQLYICLIHAVDVSIREKLHLWISTYWRATPASHVSIYTGASARRFSWFCCSKVNTLVLCDVPGPCNLTSVMVLLHAF